MFCCFYGPLYTIGQVSFNVLSYYRVQSGISDYNWEWYWGWYWFLCVCLPSILVHLFLIKKSYEIWHLHKKVNWANNNYTYNMKTWVGWTEIEQTCANRHLSMDVRIKAMRMDLGHFDSSVEPVRLPFIPMN
jgi:hypothetical protein